PLRGLRARRICNARLRDSAAAPDDAAKQDMLGAMLATIRSDAMLPGAWPLVGAVWARNSTCITCGLRLGTGLILFSFATCHLLHHSFGIRPIGAMQVASEVLLALWQSVPGLWLLYGAFITHATLGLMALYRRRHLRMPAAEAWQLALGLCILLL